MISRAFTSALPIFCSEVALYLFTETTDAITAEITATNTQITIA